MAMDRLTWSDYLILVAFLVISLGIGVYHSLTGGRQRTTSEFIVANRSLKVLPTALSLLVSFQSAILVLGTTAEMYSYGVQLLIMNLILFVPVILLTMQVAVPWIYPLKLVSINEYFKRRFDSRAVTILASIASIIAGIFYMGTAMYAPSAALESATGLPIVVSIPAMSVVAIAYTILGGMRAVIWTDVFQCVIMFAGILTILIKGLVVVGGFGNVVRLCSQTGRLDWVDWSPDPTVRHTAWGFIFGWTMQWFGVYGISQAAVQRYSAVTTLSNAKITVALNLPIFWAMILITCLTGLVVVSYYASIGCDPLANGEISNANQLLPHFVLKIFADAPGFAGLFLATLYGGALSSISSLLSGSAANCWEDILQWKLMHWTESRKALFNRFLVLVLGIAATGLAFVSAVVPGPVTQIAMSLSSAALGPLAGMILLGGMNRHANWKGAVVGGITSLVFSFWLIGGSFTVTRRHPSLPHLGIRGCTKTNNFTSANYDDTAASSSFQSLNDYPIGTTMMDTSPQTNETMGYRGLERFYSVSYQWFFVSSSLIAIIVGSVASLLLGNRSKEDKVDDNLLIRARHVFRWSGDSNSDSSPEEYPVSDYNGTIDNGAEEKGKEEQPIIQEVIL